MRRRPVLALLVVAALVGACGGAASPEASDLARARARWEASGVTSYRYTIDRSCFCPLVTRTVTVVDGVVTSVEVTPPDSPATTGSTIEELFDELDTILGRSGRGQFSAVYDAQRGFPTAVSADPILRAADDEFSYTISGFEVLSG